MSLPSTTLSGRSSAQRVWLGLAVSPLVATAIGIVALLAIYGLAPFVNVTATAIAIAPLGYLCELLFALPLHFLVKRNAAVEAWHLLALGSFAGCLVSLLMAWVMFPARGTSVAEGATELAAKLVPFGATVGLALWWSAYRRSRD